MKLYSTLSKQVENFTPISAPKVNLFVCGPTVYDYSHLGHAKTYVQMDLLARVLKVSGYDVYYLQNITDIDDKIILRAAEKKIGWDKLASQFEAAYFEDMQALNNKSVTKYAKATDYIKNIIRQVQVLLDKGHAYKIGDGIYFEVATFKSYGKLSGRTEVKEDDAQTRIDHSDEKKGWNDFCLWKFSNGGEPSWEAPFGKGRPGWHIEDTAITEHHFGPQYDIHGGAVDLIFPHHEAEITQMESASGKQPLVRIWTHAGFLNIDSGKMSKSKGNFFTIREVIAKGYDPMAIRLLMLSSHYRSELNFSWEALDAAVNRLRTLRALADLRWQPQEDTGTEAEELAKTKKQILAALHDDLNSPESLAVLGVIESKLENGVSKDMQQEFTRLIKWVDEVFGLNLSQSKDLAHEQKELLDRRRTSREKGDFTASDKIRDVLKEQGIGVNDTPGGQIWHRL